MFVKERRFRISLGLLCLVVFAKKEGHAPFTDRETKIILYFIHILRCGSLYFQDNAYSEPPKQKRKMMTISHGGVSLKYLEGLSFENVNVEEADVNAVCKGIQRLTNQTGGSLHSFLRMNDETCIFASEVAELFVSYAWAYNWKKLLASIRSHCETVLKKDDAFIWIDVAVVDQTSIGRTVMSPEDCPLHLGKH